MSSVGSEAIKQRMSEQGNKVGKPPFVKGQFTFLKKFIRKKSQNDRQDY